MLTVLLFLVVAYGLVAVGVALVRRARRQRRPTPQPGISWEMQLRMARACVTTLTTRGVRELPTINKMAAPFALRRAHFEELVVRPEEDHARATLMRLAR